MVGRGALRRGLDWPAWFLCLAVRGGPMGVLTARAAAMGMAGLLLCACGPQADGSGSPSLSPGSSAVPSHITIPGAGEALLWGAGPYGVVLLHQSDSDAGSWAGQGAATAGDRMTAVALETVNAQALRAAI